MKGTHDWQECQTQIFWAEIAPYDHVVQIYESKDVFLDTLMDFVGNGINAGDCVIVIATREHLDALNERLSAHALKIKTLISEGQYVPLEAREALARFMVNGWPDEELFTAFISELISQSKIRNRQVRAFGEMVALLWDEGHNGATVALEHMWNRFCAKEGFCLFCAYPKSGFTQDPKISIREICCTHSKMISGDYHYRNTLSYKKLESEKAV